MNVLVMGGNRFFGRRLVSFLLEAKAQVTVLNRGSIKDDFGGRVQHIVADRKILSPDTPGIQGQTWDVVYDQICYDATDALVACQAFEGKTKNYIFTSSQSVYNEGKALKEEAFQPQEHDFEKVADRNLDYAEGKRQAEAVFAAQAKFPVTFVRFPIVLGPDDYTARLKWHTDRIVADKKIYIPDIGARISLIHSADAARVLFSLRTKPFGKPLNACAEAPVKLKDIISLIEAKSHKVARIVSSHTRGEDSPFGVKGDWYMDASRLKSLGLTMDPIEKWLPLLVDHYLKK